MKKTLGFLLAVAVSAALFAEGGKPKQAEWVGQKGPRILLFNGGRPWQGDGIAKLLSGTGLRVRNFNSVYLDGFGGASIKAHVSDKKEPKAYDGFTPAFSHLMPMAHKLVVFHMTPEANYATIFTP
ncbi:MAG: hypothetical protein MJ016_05465, partial [Victivallaceae bacterium]|nr:hypothetical protein [Victivallaceae bacterium]